ncbi:MAG TPA: response regulator [Devosia sp.]|nr:response regulator [Devosia sp.]
MSDRVPVLVVEDESLIRMDVADQLRREGFEAFEAFEAGNADEAIALLASGSSIQVMFPDIDRPGSMDGRKLSAAVRNRWPPVRVIVTSGHRRAGTTDLPAGSLFLSRPYQHNAVVSSMRELIAN